MFKITSRWLHQDSIKIEWNIGKRCNYDCSYCPSVIHDNYSSHTDIDILKNTVDQIKEIRKPARLSFTGGEPCIHPDFEKLLEYCKYRGIDWVNITTNGTRTAEWYLKNECYFNHLVFSLHFEYEWDRILKTINAYYARAKNNFFVNIMAHHQHMNGVKKVVESFDNQGIKYAVRRIRWSEGDHNVFDDLRYESSDLEWLLKKESTAEANTVIDDKQIIHANDVIKLHLNKFKNWTCNAGLESLMINWDGEVHRATCRVGGSLGNIYQKTFSIPQEPVNCTRDNCTCAADIPITKFKHEN
jgi:MoaA/NifB/PqqE/SkfB family radical SAM enzyme